MEIRIAKSNLPVQVVDGRLGLQDERLLGVDLRPQVVDQRPKRIHLRLGVVDLRLDPRQLPLIGHLLTDPVGVVEAGLVDDGRIAGVAVKG